MSTTHPDYIADWGDHQHFPATGDPAWDHVLDEVAHPETVRAEYGLACTAHQPHTGSVADTAEKVSTTCPN